MTVEREETGRAEVATEEDLGYQKALGPRQIQMIAIGGAIGTGLFMGREGDYNRRARPWFSCTRCADSSRS